jgi:ABC-type sugar transport system permease subunit
MINKKSQLKIQEMSFMILALVLLFIIVGLFFIMMVYSSLYKSANLAAKNRVVLGISNLAGSPEFTCGESNCIDEDKLMALTWSNITNYRNFWTFDSLRIVKSSGFNKSKTELIKCTLGNYPNCDFFELYDKKSTSYSEEYTFSALCRKEKESTYIYERCDIAKIYAKVKLRVEGK